VIFVKKRPWSKRSGPLCFWCLNEFSLVLSGKSFDGRLFKGKTAFAKQKYTEWQAAVYLSHRPAVPVIARFQTVGSAKLILFYFP